MCVKLCMDLECIGAGLKLPLPLHHSACQQQTRAHVGGLLLADNEPASYAACTRDHAIYMCVGLLDWGGFGLQRRLGVEKKADASVRNRTLSSFTLKAVSVGLGLRVYGSDCRLGTCEGCVTHRMPGCQVAVVSFERERGLNSCQLGVSSLLCLLCLCLDLLLVLFVVCCRRQRHPAVSLQLPQLHVTTVAARRCSRTSLLPQPFIHMCCTLRQPLIFS